MFTFSTTATPPSPPRHTPTATLRRVTTYLGVAVAVAAVLALLVIYTVYQFKLSAAVFGGDVSAAQFALHVVSQMRGWVLLLFGGLILVDVGVAFARARKWVAQDTLEALFGVGVCGWGGVVLVWERFGLL